MTTDHPLRTIIVDDEPLAVERLETLCRDIAGIDVIASATDPEHAVTLMADLSPDLVLLDIAMPEIDGLAVAAAAGGLAYPPAIVFCTAFEQFAVEAFAVAAIDYLLKPVTPAHLLRAIARVRRAAPGEIGHAARPSAWAEHFWVPQRQRLVRISAGDIDRIEAERDYMRLHVEGRSYLLRQTISHLAERLDPEQFVRIHRSHIVRRDLITALGHDGSGNWSVELENGEALRIGPNYLAAVRGMVAEDDTPAAGGRQ